MPGGTPKKNKKVKASGRLVLKKHLYEKLLSLYSKDIWGASKFAKAQRKLLELTPVEVFQIRVRLAMLRETEVATGSYEDAVLKKEADGILSYLEKNPQHDRQVVILTENASFLVETGILDKSKISKDLEEEAPF